MLFAMFVKILGSEINIFLSLPELFHTERNHVRDLKVMNYLFYEPMSKQSWLSDEIVKLLFPNIKDMLNIHSK